MSRTAVVLSVEGPSISVLPVSKLECASCSASCGNKQAAVVVSNPRGFPLRVGELVYIEANARRQALEALFSLLFPFLSAVGGYFAAGPLASRLTGRASDGLRAAFVLLFLFLSSALVLLVTRLLPQGGRSEIVGVGGPAGDGRGQR